MSPCESREGHRAPGRIRTKLEQGVREEQRWLSGLQEAGAGPGEAEEAAGTGGQGVAEAEGGVEAGLCTDVTLSSFFCPSSESPERSRL